MVCVCVCVSVCVHVHVLYTSVLLWRSCHWLGKYFWLLFQLHGYIRGRQKSESFWPSIQKIAQLDSHTSGLILPSFQSAWSPSQRAWQSSPGQWTEWQARLGRNVVQLVECRVCVLLTQVRLLCGTGFFSQIWLSVQTPFLCLYSPYVCINISEHIKSHQRWQTYHCSDTWKIPLFGHMKIQHTLEVNSQRWNVAAHVAWEL